MATRTNDYYIAAYRRPFFRPLIVISIYVPILYFVGVFVANGSIVELIQELPPFFTGETLSEDETDRYRRRTPLIARLLHVLVQNIPHRMKGETIAAVGALISAAMIVSFVKHLALLLNRRRTVFADPRGLVLFPGAGRLDRSPGERSTASVRSRRPAPARGLRFAFAIPNEPSGLSPRRFQAIWQNRRRSLTSCSPPSCSRSRRSAPQKSSRP